MKFLTQTLMENFDVLYESVEGSTEKEIKLRGPFAVAEQKNQNGRVYKLSVLNEAIDVYRNEYIKNKQNFGELEHPKDVTKINYENACHRVDKLDRNGNIFIGESTVLATRAGKKGSPKGDILASILDYGGKPGVSSRAVGELNENNEVDKSLIVITFDIVTQPSGPGCYLDSIMESRDFLINEYGEILEKHIDILENKTKHLPKKDTADFIKKAFDDFLKSF
jgi:hypothetical protein